MVKVRSIREHTNFYGDKPRKVEGMEYELPDNMVKTLVEARLVEEVAADEPQKVAKK